MVVADDDFPPGLLRRSKNAFHPARRQRERPLAHYVDFGFQRTKNVWLVQMIWSGDDDSIDLIQLEKILDVRKHVGHAEPLGDRARLRAIVVAESNELSAFDFGENGKVR